MPKGITRRMSEFAAQYTKKFRAVIPVGAWSFETKDGEYVSAWKKPLVKNWCVDPIKTPKRASDYWERYLERYHQTPGIGIPTGQIVGYVVIDLDRNHRTGIDGYDFLKTWERETRKKIPETWTAITPNGGYHLWFSTDKAMRCFSNPSAGVDLRADGGLVVVPPSMGQNGNRYQWEIGYNPSSLPCAELDDTVMSFLDYCRPSRSEYEDGRSRELRSQDTGSRKMLLPDEILEGGRHDPLISLIGTLNRLGVSDEAIMQTVRMENAEKCRPPLTEEELQREIFPAIFRWPKGVAEDEWKDREKWKREQREAYQSQRAKEAAERTSQLMGG